MYAGLGIGFFSMIIYTMINMLIPLWTLDLGFSPSLLGLSVAVSSMGIAVTGIPLGNLCDKFGARQVLLVSIVGVIVTIIIYPLIRIYIALLLIQLVGGLVRVLMWIAAQTYIISENEAAITKNVAFFSVAANVGTFGGPLLIGLLIQKWGYGYSFYFLGFLALMFFLFILITTKSRSEGELKTGDLVTSFKQYTAGMLLLQHKGVQVVLLYSFFRLLLFGFSESFYPAYLDNLDYSNAMIGGLLSFTNLVSALAALFGTWLSCFTGKENLLAISLLLGSLGMMLIPSLAEFFSASIILTGFYGASLGLSQLLLISLSADYTKINERGLIVGLRTTVNRIALTILPLLLGVLVSQLGYRLAFLSTGFLMVSGVLLTYLYGIRKHIGEKCKG